MKKIMMVMLTCLIAQTAWAGWVVTYKDANRGEKSQAFYDRGKANFGGMIFTDKYVLLADKGARAYWKGTPDQYCNAVKAQMQKIKAQVAAQMAQIYAKKPEYRPVPISQKKVTRKKIGTKSIAGFSATGYNFFVDGSPENQIWVSSDSGLSGILDFERVMEKKLKCFEGLNDNSNLEDSALYKQTVKGAFLLKESHRQVVSVERKSIPSGNFEAPAGYKHFSDYQKFYDHISNVSRSSSREPSRPAAAPPSFDMPERSRREAQPEPEIREQDQEQEDNVIVKDAKDIGRGAVDEAHQSTKQGIQDEISNDIQKGVNKLMDSFFR